MKLRLTLKKDEHNVFCGYLFFMEHLLIHHGKKVEDVEYKMKATLQSMYELSPDAVQLEVQAHHTVKALHVISRLKRKVACHRVEVSFDSAYFSDI